MVYCAQVDPVQALNIPVIPIGTILAAAHPLASHPPYVLSWLNTQISAQGMMHPELFEKLVLNNFCKSKFFRSSLNTIYRHNAAHISTCIKC